MELEKMLLVVAGLPAEDQELFFERVSGIVSKTELKALQIGVSYFRMLKYPELKEAMKKALSETLYNQFKQD